MSVSDFNMAVANDYVEGSEDLPDGAFTIEQSN